MSNEPTAPQPPPAPTAPVAPDTTRSSARARPDDVLAVAEFDERLPTYFMLQALFGMLLTFVLIPVIPFWLFLGMPLHRKQFESLSAVLTRRSLKIEGGVLVRVQKSVPLDKITDLALNEGPILRHFGLCSLKIETAGGGQGASTGQAALVGVKDAIGFRDRVLAQRDAIVFGDEDGPVRAPRERGESGSDDGTARRASDTAVLLEIRDSLARIEKHLDERRG